LAVGRAPDDPRPARDVLAAWIAEQTAKSCTE